MEDIKHFWNTQHLKWVFWVLVLVWWCGIYVVSTTGGSTDWGNVVRETGRLTWYLLLFTIFISLIHKMIPTVWQINNIVDLRKHTGIFCWILALAHASAEMVKRGISTDLSAIVNASFSKDHGMVFGAVSFLIMLPLFLTSTNFAVRKMGYVAWKRLHRLTHVAFVLAAVHILIAIYQSTGEIFLRTAGALTFYVVGYLIVFWKHAQERKHTVTTPIT